MRWILLALLMLGGAAWAQDVTRPAAGLRVAALPGARVYVPDDMAAGDTISGVVVGDESGSAELTGVVVDVEERRVKPGEPFVVKVPESGTVRVRLWDAQGGKVGEVAVEGQACTPVADKGWWVAPVAWPGADVQVLGKLDGSSSTTEVRLEGRKLRPLVESPRKTVFRVPSMAPRRCRLWVRDGAEVFEAWVRIVDLDEPRGGRPSNPLDDTRQDDAPPLQVPGSLPVPPVPGQ